MKREEYITKLQSCLHGLEKSDIEDAINYCEEFFDEAESEEKAMEDLGTPAQFAAQIKTEMAIKTTQNPDNYRKPRSMMKSFLMILGGLFALPIAIPLLFVAILLFIVFGLLILTFAIVGIIATIALYYGAFATFFMSFFYSDGVGDIIIHFGVSLLLLGFALLIQKGTVYLIRGALPIFVNKTSQFYQRHKKGVQS